MGGAMMSCVMKNIQDMIWNRSRRKPREFHEQLELPLPGSRITRDEVGFLGEIRRLREQLASAGS
jgi:hypothetical protein